MSEPNKAQETKIALLIESFEGFVCTLLKDPNDMGDARKEMHDRLREFLLPAIRIIDGGEQEAGGGVHITCQKCSGERQCLDFGIGACPEWAASIKAAYAVEEADNGGAVA